MFPNAAITDLLFLLACLVLGVVIGLYCARAKDRRDDDESGDSLPQQETAEADDKSPPPQGLTETDDDPWQVMDSDPWPEADDAPTPAPQQADDPPASGGCFVSLLRWTFILIGGLVGGIIGLVYLFTGLDSIVANRDSGGSMLALLLVIAPFVVFILYGSIFAPSGTASPLSGLFSEGIALRIIAVILWFISLNLPGIIFESHDKLNETMNGYDILGYSLLAFLATGGMAVYANFFFWLLPFTGAKLPVLRLIIMWVLALTMFAMQDIPATGEGPSRALYAWGWGAFLWLYALFLMTLAVAEYEARQARARHLLALAVGIIGFAVLYSNVEKQYRQAGSDERVRLFPPGTALVVWPLTGVNDHPYPENLQLPAAARLRIRNDSGDDLRTLSELKLVPSGDVLASPPQARRGYYYQRYGELWLGRAGEADYTYRISRDDKHYHVTLADARGSLWQQDYTHFPHPRRLGLRILPKPPSDLLARAEPPEPPENLGWETRCDLTLHDGGASWQGPDLIPTSGKILPTAYCGADYDLLLTATGYERFRLEAYLYDKRTQTIVARYHSWEELPQIPPLHRAGLGKNDTGGVLLTLTTAEDALVLHEVRVDRAEGDNVHNP